MVSSAAGGGPTAACYAPLPAATAAAVALSRKAQGCCGRAVKPRLPCRSLTLSHHSTGQAEVSGGGDQGAHAPAGMGRRAPQAHAQRRPPAGQQPASARPAPKNAGPGAAAACPRGAPPTCQWRGHGVGQAAILVICIAPREAAPKGRLAVIRHRLLEQAVKGGGVGGRVEAAQQARQPAPASVAGRVGGGGHVGVSMQRGGGVPVVAGNGTSGTQAGRRAEEGLA